MMIQIWANVLVIFLHSYWLQLTYRRHYSLRTQYDTRHRCAWHLRPASDRPFYWSLTYLLLASDSIIAGVSVHMTSARNWFWEILGQGRLAGLDSSHLCRPRMMGWPGTVTTPPPGTSGGWWPASDAGWSPRRPPWSPGVHWGQTTIIMSHAMLGRQGRSSYPEYSWRV